MPIERAAYFKTHTRTADRAAFDRRQRARLKRLRETAACVALPPATTTPTVVTTVTGTTSTAQPTTSTVVSTPAATTTAATTAATIATTTTTGATTTVAPTTTMAPPAQQETFVFGAEMTVDAQDEIRGDVHFAMQDEAALLGTSIATVSAFASTSSDWLGIQQCQFLGRNDSGCILSTQQRYAGGGSAGEGGPGAIFLYWAAPTWQSPPGPSKQKIIAHELFHTFQYQLDKLVHNGETPSSQVRPSGPVWLDEGAPEMVGYHVAADRGLIAYSAAVTGLISGAKQISTPLDMLQTRDQTQIPGVYSLFAVAVDHLVSITPAGLPALTTYYNALGNGRTWPDAFMAAFGMTVDAYYANFAAYRSTL